MLILVHVQDTWLANMDLLARSSTIFCRLWLSRSELHVSLDCSKENRWWIAFSHRVNEDVLPDSTIWRVEDGVFGALEGVILAS